MIPNAQTLGADSRSGELKLWHMEWAFMTQPLEPSYGRASGTREGFVSHYTWPEGGKVHRLL